MCRTGTLDPTSSHPWLFGCSVLVQSLRVKIRLLRSWLLTNIAIMQSAVKQLMEATVNTAVATPASRPGAAVRRRRQSAPPPPARWRVVANEVLAKLRTRRTWVATMFVLGTLDVTLNLVNFVQLSSDELNYGLVIGPPSQDLWTSLCVFTVFGTLLYIPESINTFSVLYR